MKFKRIYALYLIPLSLFLVCLVTALFVRFSYTDNPLQYLDGEFSSDTDGFCVGRQPTEIKSLDDMFEKSDLIVRGRMEADRQITVHALFTNFRVTEVYKGDQALANTDIVVVEPIVLIYYPDGSTTFQTHGGYMPLIGETEYLLFLTAREWIPEKTLSDYEKAQYFPAYPGAYSVYKISTKKQDNSRIKPEGILVPYLEVQDLDIYSRSKDAIENYYKMKDQIFDHYHIS